MDLAHRIETIMRIAAVNEADTLVLGAFGCGFFGNDPEQVAGLLKSWLDAHGGQFEKVVFSIAGGPALDAFREAFARLRDGCRCRVLDQRRTDGFSVVFLRHRLSSCSSAWSNFVRASSASAMVAASA